MVKNCLLIKVGGVVGRRVVRSRVLRIEVGWIYNKCFLVSYCLFM